MVCVYKWWFHWISSNIFFYWYIELSLFQEEKNYTHPISGTKIYPIAKFLTLLLFSLVSFHQELVSFWKIEIYLIDWYRISPSCKGRSHHDYVDSGHGWVRKFGGRAANLCWLSEDTLTNLNCTSFQGELNYFKRIIVCKVRDVRAVSLHHLWLVRFK